MYKDFGMLPIAMFLKPWLQCYCFGTIYRLFVTHVALAPK